MLREIKFDKLEGGETYLIINDDADEKYIAVFDGIYLYATHILYDRRQYLTDITTSPTSVLMNQYNVGGVSPLKLDKYYTFEDESDYILEII